MSPKSSCLDPSASRKSDFLLLFALPIALINEFDLLVGVGLFTQKVRTFPDTFADSYSLVFTTSVHQKYGAKRLSAPGAT